jgi:hypothetical protein
MARKYRKHFNIAFLSIFLGLTLSINYLHTGDTLQRSDSCPACQFQDSTLATAQIHFFHLPQLSVLEIIKVFESFHIQLLVTITPSSRSPPQWGPSFCTSGEVLASPVI